MLRKIKTLSLAAIGVVLMSSSAFAASGGSVGVFNTVATKGVQLFQGVRDVIFIIGGFGLVGLAVGAIFGRVNWKWFGGLAFGLAVVAAAGAVVNYMTSSGGTSTTGYDLADTLT